MMGTPTRTGSDRSSSVKENRKGKATQTNKDRRIWRKYQARDELHHPLLVRELLDY